MIIWTYYGRNPVVVTFKFNKLYR